MAKIISGDINKGIKGVGELALRISRFDSYRLFTLYENVNERKVMDVSGNQKYYLVFRSPNKEIRIPEYDPKGFFEVDKVNGCVLFKITKKNAEDILGLKTGGEKIFYIIRVYEETDSFGKVLSITDEVEVYHGKWGDDEAFTTFTTENKVDYLEKALAEMASRYQNLYNTHEELQNAYNKEFKDKSDLESQLETMRAENDRLNTQINEINGNTVEGTLLSTDTTYIALDSAFQNLNITEEHYQNALNQALNVSSGSTIDYYDADYEEDLEKVTIDLVVKVEQTAKDLDIEIIRGEYNIGNATYGNDYVNEVDANDNTTFTFKCNGAIGGKTYTLSLSYEKDKENGFDGAVLFKPSQSIEFDNGTKYIHAQISHIRLSGEHVGSKYAKGNLGKLTCKVCVE